jgi:tRNA G18 (ribose-2'-O)-methylase SpoU
LPTQPTQPTLNVSTAAAVALYELVGRRTVA